MKTYTIIGGVNGVGKSSLLGALNAESTGLGIIVDENKLQLKFTDQAEKSEEAVRIINDCLEKGVNFTQETTLSGVRTLKTIERARELGYYIKLYYVGVSSCAESLERIANRVRKGGHDIPREDVLRRFDKRFDDLCKVLPYCNEVKLFDNENGFVEAAEYRNGQIIPKLDPLPEWLVVFISYFKEKTK